MKWRGRRRGRNIEDRRGTRIGRGGRGARIGGIGLVLAVVAVVFFDVDPRILLQGLDTGAPAPSAPARPATTSNDPGREFVAVVLADTEETWGELFSASGKRYREPTLVLFSGAVQSACGFAQAAVGPFYCPGDAKVYIDLSFYDDLARRFGAPGDFAQAYVIAHEIGHHVQNLLGITERVHAMQQRTSREQANALSVRLELQADCLAGVWAHHAERARDLLERGDIEEGLRAAAAIGDDRLQERSRGYVAPDSFTHGSSEQRVRWFRRGIESGRTDSCDTFSAERL